MMRLIRIRRGIPVFSPYNVKLGGRSRVLGISILWEAVMAWPLNVERQDMTLFHLKGTVSRGASPSRLDEGPE
jgi:hypothetical protein